MTSKPTDPQAPSRFKDSQTGQVYEYDGERWQPVTTYEEWRVTVTTEHNAPVKGVMFTPEDPGDAEARAQSFANWARYQGWTDGPHLHKRTVTVTDWTEVDT